MSSNKDTVDIGRMDRVITVQSQVSTQDGYGQLTNTWQDVYSCFANIDVQQSQLIYSTAEFVEKAVFRITTRYTSSIVFSPQMRIQYQSLGTSITHTYVIQSIMNPQQANKYLIFMCYELAAKQ